MLSALPCSPLSPDRSYFTNECAENGHQAGNGFYIYICVPNMLKQWRLLVLLQSVPSPIALRWRMACLELLSAPHSLATA